ncbi:MAG: hypothetical protein NPIRA02_31050 [Nitrospirales bacterium]|nr:MAG: hypothetical protein NPIRA02_31050 [Nitrospirales bacterium]
MGFLSTHHIGHNRPSRPWTVGTFLVALVGIMLLSQHALAEDPFGPVTPSQDMTRDSPDLAFDQKNWKRPQGVFSWITMARGYQTPWDSHGRPGWLTDDAYVEPVDPGVSTFPPDTPEIFIVFEGQPLDAPGQFAAAWYPLVNGVPHGEEPLGQDIIELEMNQRYGYFIISPPKEKWDPGRYLVNIYYGSPGQALHAVNVMGTMTFTISE